MAKKMEVMRGNSEKLVKYMNSSKQDPEPVLTMTTKMNRAWDEFEEKFQLAKDDVVQEDKPSKVCKLPLIFTLFVHCIILTSSPQCCLASGDLCEDREFIC